MLVQMLVAAAGVLGAGLLLLGVVSLVSGHWLGVVGIIVGGALLGFAVKRYDRFTW